MTRPLNDAEKIPLNDAEEFAEYAEKSFREFPRLLSSAFFRGIIMGRG